MLIVIAAFPVCGAAQTTANALKPYDTRDIIDSPVNFDRTVRIDFKRRTTVGVPGAGNYSGQLTIAPWADNSGGKHYQLNFNEGGVFYRNGHPDDVSWGAWQKLLIENENGNVGIGTITPVDKLSVNGRIRAREVKVEMANWPDYVFRWDYALQPLPELEAYIKRHSRLPGIPSAQEAETEGIDLGEMNRKLLEKVEQLTLYLLAQEKQLKANDEREREQNHRIEQLEKLVRGLLPESSQ
ncbi:hypothetical protein [Parapedobacter tibetensis]|nr:hypothetical protein [Parapedobacter tibetensis]